MTHLPINPQFHLQFDTISEPSTDGDDVSSLENCVQKSKKKRMSENKMKSSLCRNFS
jgi:hypothetical protein